MQRDAQTSENASDHVGSGGAVPARNDPDCSRNRRPAADGELEESALAGKPNDELSDPKQPKKGKVTGEPVPLMPLTAALMGDFSLPRTLIHGFVS